MKRRAQSVDGEDGEQVAKKAHQPPPHRPPIPNGLYFTKVEGLPAAANAKAFSLYELIHRINPIASIHFNYCMLPQFILSEYPRRCRHLPITLVVGQPQAASTKELAAEFPNITVHGASIPFSYGTHHSKLSIFESEDALHVVISTANLIPDDYGLKTQCFFYCRAPFLATLDSTSNSIEEKETPNTSSTSTTSSSAFADDLLEYLEEAYAHKTFIDYWRERIRDGGADFSAVRDRIVASRPGRHTGAKIHDYGHMKLRRLLGEKFSADELKRQKVRIAQFSSIGSLGAQPQTWLCDEFLRSLSGGVASNMNPNSLKLIYPSVENVRCSLEGYEAGKSLPYTSGVNSRQPYLRHFLHQWKSDRLKRTRAMPHVKSYTALEADTNEPRWLLITSANLSQAAWGRLEKGESQLFCRSYELGVLLCLKDHPELEEAGGLVLPYDLPLTKFSEADSPFLCDATYTEPDGMGYFSVADCE